MQSHRRKCRHCHQWFVPDPRNAWHQQYCSDPECRKGSRAASQRKWRHKNPDYFCGAEHRQRVADWRARHPFYWRKKAVFPARAKDVFPPQPPFFQPPATSATSPFPSKPPPLQDLVMLDHFILVGLAAMQTGPAFKDLIAPTLVSCYKKGKVSIYPVFHMVPTGTVQTTSPWIP